MEQTIKKIRAIAEGLRESKKKELDILELMQKVDDYSYDLDSIADKIEDDEDKQGG